MNRTSQLTSLLLLSLALDCSHLQQATNTQQSKEVPAGTPSQSPRVAAARGTPAEARAMLQQAVDHYNSVGRSQALADFTAKRAPFVDRDLYVFCLGSDGKTVANGGFPAYVGTPANMLKGADGKPLGTAIINAAARKDEGSIQYRWINPVSHQQEPKTAFWKRVGEDVCGVGAYSPG
jgi:cytochrome c